MKKLAVFVTLISVLVCSAVFAADIPAPTSEFYVNDAANVLSDKTKKIIIDKNLALYEKTGAQIVVVTVEYTHTASIADYAYELFNEYKIGSAEKNNGLLLLLSIGDDDYYVLQGEGLERTLSSGSISYLLYEHLEPYFAKQQYDEGVLNIFNVLYKEMLAIHDTTIEYEDVYPPEDSYYFPDDYFEQEDSSFSLFGFFVTVFAIMRVIFFFMVVFGVLSAIFGKRKSTRRSNVVDHIVPIISTLGYMNNNTRNYSSFNNNSSTVNRSSYSSGSSSYSSGRSSSSSRSSFSSGSRSSSSGSRSSSFSSGGGGSSRGGGAGRGGR